MLKKKKKGSDWEGLKGIRSFTSKKRQSGDVFGRLSRQGGWCQGDPAQANRKPSPRRLDVGTWDPGGRQVEPFWPVAWRDKSSGDQQKVTGQGVQDLDFLIVTNAGTAVQRANHRVPGCGA